MTQPRSPARQIHIYDYLRVLYKWRKPAILCFAAIVVIVAVASFIATPIYKATSRILIDREIPRALDIRQMLPGDATGTEFYQTQYKLLQSKSFVLKVIRTLNLSENRTFMAETGLNKKFITKEEKEGLVIERFYKHYSVEPIRNSRLVDLSFESKDPSLAATVANAIAKAYIVFIMEHKSSTSSEAADFLSKQINEQKIKLEESEQALQNYKEKYGIVQLTQEPGQKESENVAMQRLAGLNASLIKAQTERLEAESRYKEVQDLIAKNVPYESIPPISNSPLILTLRSSEAKLETQISEASQKFGDKHPKMVQLKQELEATRQKIKLEAKSVVNAIKNDYAIARAKENSARSAVEGQKAEAQKLSEHSIQYGVFLREVEKNRELYENLLKRLKETSVEHEFGATNIKIIDSATAPIHPAKPKKARNILLSFVVGLFMGVGLAFFLEYLDNTVKSPEDVKEHFNAPNLAIIPSIDFKAEAGEAVSSPELIVHHKPKSIAAEAFRSLRTAILFSFPENPPKSFVVTSFMPQEGKSFIAVNTALIMASAGDRVLLIDADLRRPMIHNLLKVNNERGLTNMIVGGGGARPLDLNERLSVIPSGPIPPNPSELLGSQNFLELMEGLKWEYDKVVIDAPPINSVTDALVVSKSLESGVIFVIKAGVTTKEMVRDAKGMLDGINARILGGVLNNVRMNSSGYYHYSSYHYYHKYYGDEDKANGDGKKKRGLWAVTKAVTAAGMGRKTVD